jgi:hypothetical protein
VAIAVGAIPAAEGAAAAGGAAAGGAAGGTAAEGAAGAGGRRAAARKASGSRGGGAAAAAPGGRSGGRGGAGGRGGRGSKGEPGRDASSGHRRPRGSREPESGIVGGPEFKRTYKRSASKALLNVAENSQLLVVEYVACVVILFAGTLVAPQGSKDGIPRLLVKGSALSLLFFILALMGAGGRGAAKAAGALGFLVTVTYLFTSSDAHNVVEWLGGFFGSSGTIQIGAGESGGVFTGGQASDGSSSSSSSAFAPQSSGETGQIWNPPSSSSTAPGSTSSAFGPQS